MQVITTEAAIALPGSVVSVGMFDGVHRGHRHVLHLLRELGRARRLPTVVVTFDPHPRALLRPESAPVMLTTLDDRMRLLAATGAADYCLVLPFDRRRSAETADEFVRRTLIGRLGMRSLVVGENFACGRGRTGSVDYLRALGMEASYSVHGIVLRNADDASGPVPCSSTETRRLIQSGEISRATAMLGRPHEISCTVLAPQSAPRPFVDIALPDAICAPPAGDYAGVVRKTGSGSLWRPTLLLVRDSGTAGTRLVRVPAAVDAAAPGDTISLRFLERVRDALRPAYAAPLAAIA